MNGLQSMDTPNFFFLYFLPMAFILLHFYTLVNELIIITTFQKVLN